MVTDKTWNQITYAVNYVPKTLLAIFGSILVALLGATMRGEWILIAISIYKEWEQRMQINKNTTESSNTSTLNITSYYRTLPRVDNPTHEVLVQLRLENAHLFVFASVCVSFVTFYGLGGFLQYYYYVRQRDQPENWKCQPDKWLTKENERHEFILGSANMFLGGVISGLIATYIYNGGACSLYFTPLERGWIHLIVVWIATFILQDGLAFYTHRMFHITFLYKNIHKWHHRYHSPTVWSTTAMHPIEFLVFQAALIVPMFVMPIYAGSYITLLLYHYYHGITSHSGINVTNHIPWQPPTIFHDDHHKYFHVNFGFNTYIFDYLHGSIRKPNRLYGEDIFGGHGRPKEKKQ